MPIIENLFPADDGADLVHSPTTLFTDRHQSHPAQHGPFFQKNVSRISCRVSLFKICDPSASIRGAARPRHPGA